MSLLDELLTSVKSRLRTADAAADDPKPLPEKDGPANPNTDNFSEIETVRQHQPGPAPAVLSPTTTSSNSDELAEVQITQVIQTSEGKQQEIDPNRFRVYNTTRNQSLDIVIGSQAISRSMAGIQGDDNS